MASKVKRTKTPRQAVAQAAMLSQRFHGLPPRRVSRVKITWPKALVLIGHVVQLDYLSDKEDGKVRIYTHDFDKPPRLFASNSARVGKENMLLVHGNFDITELGIVG